MLIFATLTDNNEKTDIRRISRVDTVSQRQTHLVAVIRHIFF